MSLVVLKVNIADLRIEIRNFQTTKDVKSGILLCYITEVKQKILNKLYFWGIHTQVH